jgi:hypothetical protein
VGTGRLEIVALSVMHVCKVLDNTILPLLQVEVRRRDIVAPSATVCIVSTATLFYGRRTLDFA